VIPSASMVLEIFAFKNTVLDTQQARIGGGVAGRVSAVLGYYRPLAGIAEIRLHDTPLAASRSLSIRKRLPGWCDCGSGIPPRLPVRDWWPAPAGGVGLMSRRGYEQAVDPGRYAGGTAARLPLGVQQTPGGTGPLAVPYGCADMMNLQRDHDHRACRDNTM
jgi:hypothetical protein